MGNTHRKDSGGLKAKHKKGPGNEACLTGHEGSKYEVGNTCSYRWQAYEQAKIKKTLYNWPKYRPLHKANQPVKTEARTKKGALFPSWYKKTLDAPAPNAWDVDKSGENNQGVAVGNFQGTCYVPYWHEAHHVVPKGLLGKALVAAGRGAKKPRSAVRVVKHGLMDEGYNVNNKLNMFILPLDRTVARVLQLPKHRKTPRHRNHRAYDNFVWSKLNKFFKTTAQDAQKHDEPKYRKLRKRIEKLSDKLYDEIIDAGKMMTAGDVQGDALDDMGKAQSSTKPKKKKGSVGIDGIS
ncbi:MAG: AHH domain-containing protein [Myxococcaceae bacterium]|nr:AHH domain-containing protein [Myxococcaceae bacterium]